MQSGLGDGLVQRGAHLWAVDAALAPVDLLLPGGARELALCLELGLRLLVRGQRVLVLLPHFVQLGHHVSHGLGVGGRREAAIEIEALPHILHVVVGQKRSWF